MAEKLKKTEGARGESISARMTQEAFIGFAIKELGLSTEAKELRELSDRDINGIFSEMVRTASLKGKLPSIVVRISDQFLPGLAEELPSMISGGSPEERNAAQILAAKIAERSYASLRSHADAVIAGAVANLGHEDRAVCNTARHLLEKMAELDKEVAGKVLSDVPALFSRSTYLMNFSLISTMVREYPDQAKSSLPEIAKRLPTLFKDVMGNWARDLLFFIAEERPDLRRAITEETTRRLLSGNLTAYDGDFLQKIGAFPESRSIVVEAAPRLLSSKSFYTRIIVLTFIENVASAHPEELKQHVREIAHEAVSNLSHRQEEVGESAAELIVTLSEKFPEDAPLIIKSVSKLLSHDDDYVRVSAQEILAKLMPQHREAFEPGLETMLGDALANLARNDKNTVPFLMEMALHHPKRRAQMLENASELPSPESHKLVKQMIELFPKDVEPYLETVYKSALANLVHEEYGMREGAGAILVEIAKQPKPRAAIIHETMGLISGDNKAQLYSFLSEMVEHHPEDAKPYVGRLLDRAVADLADERHHPAARGMIESITTAMGAQSIEPYLDTILSLALPHLGDKDEFVFTPRTKKFLSEIAMHYPDRVIRAACEALPGAEERARLGTQRFLVAMQEQYPGTFDSHLNELIRYYFRSLFVPESEDFYDFEEAVLRVAKTRPESVRGAVNNGFEFLKAESAKTAVHLTPLALRLSDELKLKQHRAWLLECVLKDSESFPQLFNDRPAGMKSAFALAETEGERKALFESLVRNPSKTGKAPEGYLTDAIVTMVEAWGGEAEQYVNAIRKEFETGAVSSERKADVEQALEILGALFSMNFDRVWHGAGSMNFGGPSKSLEVFSRNSGFVQLHYGTVSMTVSPKVASSFGPLLFEIDTDGLFKAKIREARAFQSYLRLLAKKYPDEFAQEKLKSMQFVSLGGALIPAPFLGFKADRTTPMVRTTVPDRGGGSYVTEKHAFLERKKPEPPETKELPMYEWSTTKRSDSPEAVAIGPFEHFTNFSPEEFMRLDFDRLSDPEKQRLGGVRLAREATIYIYTWKSEKEVLANFFWSFIPSDAVSTLYISPDVTQGLDEKSREMFVDREGNRVGLDFKGEVFLKAKGIDWEPGEGMRGLMVKKTRDLLIPVVMGLPSEAEVTRQYTMNLLKLYPSDFKEAEVGKRRGSHPYHWLQDEKGEIWRFKYPELGKKSDPDAARVDYISTRLFAELGIPVPEIALSIHNGKLGIATKYLEGREAREEEVSRFDDDRITRGALLAGIYVANWDIGRPDKGTSNVYLGDDGRLYFMDFGGSLHKRALGEEKPFPERIGKDEFDKLLAPNSIWRQKLSAFEKADNESLTKMAENIAGLSDEKIDEIVDSAGFSGLYNARVGRELKRALRGRRDSIAEYFGIGGKGVSRAALPTSAAAAP